MEVMGSMYGRAKQKRKQLLVEDDGAITGEYWKAIFSRKTKLLKNREIFIRIQVFLGLAHIIMEAEKSHFLLSGDPGMLLASLL